MSQKRAEPGGKRTQLLVLTDVAPLRTSDGTLVAALDQNQTLMNELVRSIAYLKNDELRAKFCKELHTSPLHYC